MNYADGQKNPTRNIAGFGAVVLFHVALIYALVSGLGYNIVEKLAPPMAAKVVQEKNTLPPPPPPLVPNFVEPPPTSVPIQDIILQTPPLAPHAITEVIHTPTAVPSAPHPVMADQAADAAHNLSSCKPETPDDYEDRAGRVVVDCVIDAQGHPGACRVISTAGGGAFGTSVMRWLDSGCVRFRPAIRHGVPASEEHRWAVTFQPAE